MYWTCVMDLRTSSGVTIEKLQSAAIPGSMK
jgi:hypothetical protein